MNEVATGTCILNVSVITNSIVTAELKIEYVKIKNKITYNIEIPTETTNSM